MANQRGNVSVFVNVLVFALIALGVIFIVAGIAFGTLTIASGPTTSNPAASFTSLGSIANGFFVMLSGIIPGVLLLSIAAILSLLAAASRQNQLQNAALEQLRQGIQSLDVSLRLPPAPSPQPRAPAVAALPAVRPAIEESAQPLLLDLLENVRDAALMTDVQRRQLGAIHWAKRKQTLTESIERHILSGNWPPAQAQLDELQALLPEDPDVKTLADRVTGEYSSRLSEDLRAADSQLRHLLSIAAWQEANELVAALENKYPHAAQIEQMRRTIQHERDAYEREHKERILGEIAEATSHKQWRAAASAVEEYISRYPHDTLTERLRFDLTTLQENVHTQERKEAEAQFRDLLKRQRYEEALTVARNVISKYPSSSAAVELTKLLPKVEDLIRQRQHPAAAPTA
ncbi:MAG TPA: hypothetical protein VM008_01350 [Phycisphaerae bacterium]|nr:hypothetical protein [Phycisphaerae bacterium]